MGRWSAAARALPLWRLWQPTATIRQTNPRERPSPSPHGLSATAVASPGRGGLYAANTCGGVVGCLLAGFYLLRVHRLVAEVARTRLLLTLFLRGHDLHRLALEKKTQEPSKTTTHARS